MPRSCRSGSTGWFQNCSALTARILSNGTSNAGTRSTEPSLNSSRPRRTPSALRRASLAHHHRGVVEPVHIAVWGAPGQLADRDARPEPDLEHAVVALHIEQRDRPGVASAVRGAIPHDPAGDPARKA